MNIVNADKLVEWLVGEKYIMPCDPDNMENYNKWKLSKNRMIDKTMEYVSDNKIYNTPKTAIVDGVPMNAIRELNGLVPVNCSREVEESFKLSESELTLLKTILIKDSIKFTNDCVKKGVMQLDVVSECFDIREALVRKLEKEIKRLQK